MTAFLVRHARLLMAFGLFLGLSVPPLAALLRPTLPVAVGLLLLLSMLRLDWNKTAAYGRRPKVLAAQTAWLLLVAPLMMAGFLVAAPLSAGLATALVMMAAAPPITSAPALALLLGLDAALALVVLAISTLAAPLVLPSATALLAPVGPGVDASSLALRLGIVIGGAFAATLVIRAVAGARRLAAAAPLIDAGSVLMLLLFAVALMDGVTALTLERPLWVAGVIALSFAANVGLQILSALLFAPLGRREALTAGLLGGNRNMAVLLAAMPSDANPEVALFFALAQFPIFMLPALLGPAYRRLMAA